MRVIICKSWVLLFVLTNSCAWLTRVERDLVSDENATSKKKKEFVPKEKYDELLVRYQNLEKQVQSTPRDSETSLVDDLQQAPLVSTIKEGSPSVETIDVFSGDASQKSIVTSPPTNLSSNLKNDIGASLELYQRALSLIKNDQAEALKIFQHLEIHGPLSIQARSKYQIGKLFLDQQEYDLALQSFEGVVQKHAHSGIVIDSLKMLVICCDKLGLAEKKVLYSSLINDVFDFGASNT